MAFVARFLCRRPVSFSPRHLHCSPAQKFDSLRDLALQRLNAQNGGSLFECNFYDTFDSLRQDPFYEIIKMMPKGAILHTHQLACGNTDFIVNRALREANTAIYFHPPEKANASRPFLQPDGSLSVLPHSIMESLKLGDNPTLDSLLRADEALQQMLPGWHLLSAFSLSLPKALDLQHRLTDSPRTAHPKTGKPHDVVAKALKQGLTLSKPHMGPHVWHHFETRFDRAMRFVAHQQNYEEYYYSAFRHFAQENVSHVELRLVPGHCTDDEGQSLSLAQELRFLQSAASACSSPTAPFGLKVILCKHRLAGRQAVEEMLHTTENILAFQLRQCDPALRLVAGFDVIGMEGSGLLVRDYVSLLKQHSVPYYLHAGEAPLVATADVPLALSLPTLRRIGHGLSLRLFSDPTLLDTIRSQDIALEVCPLSNHILGYNSSLPHHPIRQYIQQGLPVVLSVDDGGLMGYVDFTAEIAAAVLALRFSLDELRTLMLSSLQHSALEDTEKTHFSCLFSAKWEAWAKHL